MTKPFPILACALGLVLIAGLAFANSEPPVSAGQWDQELLDLFAEIPILDSGRIKPLDTYAGFKLLRINGRRTFYPETLSTGEKLKRRFTREPIPKMNHLEWFLDCLFYPEEAKQYKHFLVDNAEVITAIGGVPHPDEPRGRYSYNELEPHRDELFRQAQEFNLIEAADQSALQSMTVNLAQNVFEFEFLIYFLEYARHPLHTDESRLVQRAFPNQEHVSVGEVIANAETLRKSLFAIQHVIQNEPDGERFTPEAEAFAHFLQTLDFAANASVALQIIPPADPEVRDWMTPADLAKPTLAYITGESPEAPEFAENEREILDLLGAMAVSVDNKLEFRQTAREFHDAVIDQAERREEFATVPLEVSFYKANYFFYAQWLFVLAFVFIALSWLNMKNKWLGRIGFAAVLLPLGLLITGITMRCIIQARPPITNLYETILFITAVAVVVALFIESVNRQRLALSVASVLGVLGMFIANKYEMTNKQDTMPTLEAVLDTNFWLATHVTIINVGYAAGMLAAAIAHVYIFGKLIGFKKNDPAFYRSVTRMVYGVMCFGLLFAFVGTVLGGIWANYSWGRFWGWDPKENGAMMIVLCMLATLHARMGGYIKQLGVNMAAVFTGMVVGFSWWGVNLLGVGLHSYGFTSGIWGATMTFWIIEGVVLALGAFIFLRDRFTIAPRTAPETTSATPTADSDEIHAK